MTLEEQFPITPEERARWEAAPFRGTDENGWRLFALAMQEQVLAGYAAGETDLRGVLDVIHTCSLGCRAGERATLMAVGAERARRITPATRKHPPNPTWVRNSAATLVSMLHENRPDEPFAATAHNDWTTPILEEAVAWLVALGLCEPIAPHTVYKWFLAWQRETPNSISK